MTDEKRIEMSIGKENMDEESEKPAIHSFCLTLSLNLNEVLKTKRAAKSLRH